jgi:hypoxanthine phosphoribosyltransferase
MNKRYFNWDDIEFCVRDLAEKVELEWGVPQMLIGISRGGLVPATMLSNLWNIPLQTWNLSLRDHQVGVSIVPEMRPNSKTLIVDDINDSGATIQTVRACKELTGIDYRIGVLYDNEASAAQSDFSSQKINKEVNPEWLVFPWEMSRD